MSEWPEFDVGDVFTIRGRLYLVTRIVDGEPVLRAIEPARGYFQQV